MDLQSEIRSLKKEKNAVILAHYYQTPDIQDIADFVGDSLALSQEAARTRADIIVFAGVHFMAETAKILNPEKRVLLPDLQASCSLAEGCPAGEYAAFRAAHPDHLALTYINCSAEVKSHSDIVCTSSNALRIVESLPPGQAILFAPDKNLGDYIQQKTGRKMLLWDAVCTVHDELSLRKLQLLMQQYPQARVVAHPESAPALLSFAHFVGSTSAMLKFVEQDAASDFIIATEAGLLHKMSALVPGKRLIPAPALQDNSCACSECPYMKMNTLEKLWKCLLDESPEIVLGKELMDRARKPIERMLEFV